MTDDKMREALQQLFDAFTDPEAGEVDRRLAIKDAREALAATQARPVDAPTDAERYAFLRSQHEVNDEQLTNNNYGKSYPPRTLTVFGDDGEDGLEPIPCDPGALDARIDAAMRATPAEEKPALDPYSSIEAMAAYRNTTVEDIAKFHRWKRDRGDDYCKAWAEHGITANNLTK